jgi:transposase, IS30 family
MGQRFHRGFTAAEKTELWDRWKRGESLKAIGRAFGKPSSSIYFLVAPHGGIRPAQRRRSRLALTLAEREVISRGITAHQSARSMAKLLGRSPSTVSREMSRNGGYDRYRATLADENTWRELVVQNIVNWQTVRGYDRQWRGSSDWIGRPSR